MMTNQSDIDIQLTDSIRNNSESKSDKSLIQLMFSTRFNCLTFEEFIGVSNMNIPALSEDFKHTINSFVNISKSRSKNESSWEFDNHLKKFNEQITFTGNQRGGEFEHVFRGKQPDFTWCIAPQFYAWNIVTVIEKKKIALTRNEISQMLEYLRMIVQISPNRKYAIGCLTNYKKIIIGRAAITNNKFSYEVFESMDVVEEYWKFIQCNPMYFGFVNFTLPDSLHVKLFLGRGAYGMVYQIEHDNIQYAMKISNVNSMKEYEINQRMKQYIDENRLDIKIINMFEKEGFILTRPIGKLLKQKDFCQRKYITQILMQLSIGNKIGLVHRDIRIYNMILFNNEYCYLIDWDSSVTNGFRGEYEGSFMTASTSVLKEYANSNGKDVRLFFADDYLSILYIILLSQCSKDQEIDLKEAAQCSNAGGLLVRRRAAFKCYPAEILHRLHAIEEERAVLTNIEDLRHRCEQIIELMHQHGLVS